jgi:hypothetical protein
MIFYKNFQNKNLLFKTTEYQSLKSLHEKILLYGNYLEKNFIKPKKRKEALLSNKDKFINEDLIKRNFSIHHATVADYRLLGAEKSFLNVAFNRVSEYFKSGNDVHINSKRKTYMRNNSNRTISLNSSLVENNDTADNSVNETYFIYNIEDRAFNAILSHNISEIFKSYLPIIVYFLLKVKFFLKSGR